nr:MAG TPA_asm: hypothetical protein [Bacteriophage sp.]
MFQCITIQIVLSRSLLQKLHGKVRTSLLIRHRLIRLSLIVLDAHLVYMLQQETLIKHQDVLTGYQLEIMMSILDIGKLVSLTGL